MDLAMSCSSLSLLFFISLHIHFLVPTSDEFLLFLECAPYDCGDQQISYPFRHKKQPNHCGYVGYELGCEDDRVILSMKSLEYRVIHMDRSTQILKVARMDLLDGICLGTRVNTTLDFSLFSSTFSDRNSTLFYNCDSFSTSLPYEFSCPPSQNGYFVLDADLIEEPIKLCSSGVFVFISREALGLLPPPMQGGDHGANISEVLNQGFEITWIADTSQCENCNNSGGRCGYDWTRQEFNCFCHDGAYPRICNVPSGLYAYSNLICVCQFS
ncbi:hypothetical protein ACJRO7_010115 [Eucalyptus globulus]|uniref:non-specific serine/threonine protein kinase n=1 Tax=Eucalyptus globulus TaxID=34317 RepID=A0ABD3LGK5_EUCGL